ncbi:MULTISPECIES: DUF5984 family protein [unclassified Kitasatospora]|uniref:DUF5984 family protein n=1 Tax=unclassified Kitasatospora TaxID=2633591 RepID=UPI00070C4CA4|nr:MULTISPECIES: DUF5984 family protein [unclassified Kitasatospora]KQV14807.1 hypothetical protein ASC99_30130 [Kitasatospora sp. Root107]KRB68163.1 hypothetical protein ASE03_29920 [Kitasatospora sp. Root187]
MIRFRFELTPVEDVRPWGSEPPALHWFALTDGWYCIDVDGHELLRYSRQEPGDDEQNPYVDYYVVRLWEDVIEVLPEALEPVPADLLDFVSRDVGRASRENSPEAEEAGSWHADHALPMGHLSEAPYIRWWRVTGDDHDSVTVTWQYRPGAEIEFAAPMTGRVTMPTASFLAAVHEFDRSLLAEMELRVTALETTGAPVGVELDLEHLRHEQRERATWLRRALERECATDWPAVRAGARELLTTRTEPA